MTNSQKTRGESMDDFISRSEAYSAIKSIDENAGARGDYIRDEEEIKRDSALYAIENVLPADVVKVVRCNECEYYDGVRHAQGHAPCRFWKSGFVMWNNYCSNGVEFKE